jgi:hypothetical protein
MSDYFTALATRSVNPAGALRPRLTPLFGPPPFDATWLAQPAELHVEPVESEASPADSDAVSLLSPAPESIVRAVAASPANPTTEPLTQRPSAPVTPPLPAAPDPSTFAAPRPSEESAGLAPLSQPSGPAAVRGHRLPSKRPGSAEGTQQRSVTIQVAPALRSSPRAAPSGESLAFPPRNRSAVVRAPAPPASIVEERGPVIQVTIGRVEVRATAPAPPQRQPRPEAPRGVSLEQYLRRQGRGGGA